MFLRAAIGLLVVLSALSAASAGFADSGFGARVPGQHVYDRATVLPANQLELLEKRAAALDALGAPTVVYVRVQAASQAQVQQESRQLMDAWDVESAPNAHDGFVMLLDLTPGNTQHGQVGMFAGAEQASAQLDAEELDRIASEVMRPSLAGGDLAGGISAGLDATAQDLGQPASAGGAANHARASNPVPFLSSLPVMGLLGLLVLPFVLPLVIIIVVVIFITNILRRATSGRGWMSSSGYQGWTDSSGWSSGGAGSGSGGDSGGASSGGDSGGSSF